MAVLRPVGHMLAAGWGGVGSVSESRMNLFMSHDEDMSISEPYEELRVVACRAAVDFPSQDDWAAIFGSIEREIDFYFLTGRLKNCNLEMLLRCGVPNGLVLALRQSVREGLDEYEVVLACLVVLAPTSGGPGLSREAIRAIRKAASGAGIEDKLLAPIAKVLHVITGRGVENRDHSRDMASVAKK